MVAAAYGAGVPAGDFERNNYTQVGRTHGTPETNRGVEKLRKSRGLRGRRRAKAQVTMAKKVTPKKATNPKPAKAKTTPAQTKSTTMTLKEALRACESKVVL